MCAGEGIEPAEVLEVLSDLVGKSLVTVAEREGGGALRAARDRGAIRLREARRERGGRTG